MADARIVVIDGPDDSRVAAYRDIGDHDRLVAQGLFVAEGRLVVERLIDARVPIRSLLLDDLLMRVQSLVLLEGVGNADNVGGIFRNAAAFGADAIVLSHGCADPLYRKAIRTSMAATLRVPFSTVPFADLWTAALTRVRVAGFQLVALTPGREAIDLDTWAAGRRDGERVALLLGTEGAGLSAESEALADVRVKIPIKPDVDSLNVAVAAGIAMYRLLKP
jgi:tRNA G18 (ribose-2'-O)-methylase SpoU